MEDSRSLAAGGTTLGFQIWEAAIIPMLLWGCETWHSIPKKTMRQLNAISLKQIRVCLGIGKQGFQIPCLYFECGILTMENRILLKKLLFNFHVFNLPENSLAKEYHSTQLRLSLPGIALQCHEILSDWNMEDMRLFTKRSFKKAVTAKIRKKNKDELVQQMKNYRKIDFREYERKDFKMSEYFHTLNIADSRMRLRSKLGMVPSIRNNFRNNKRYKEENYQCPDCFAMGIPDKQDEQEHVLTSSCVANSDLREGRNLENDKDICDFFRDLVNRRNERYGA